MYALINRTGCFQSKLHEVSSSSVFYRCLTRVYDVTGMSTWQCACSECRVQTWSVRLCRSQSTGTCRVSATMLLLLLITMVLIAVLVIIRHTVADCGVMTDTCRSEHLLTSLVTCAVRSLITRGFRRWVTVMEATFVLVSHWPDVHRKHVCLSVCLFFACANRNCRYLVSLRCFFLVCPSL